MKLDVPYKILDIEPEAELINFNFDLISEEEWFNNQEMKSIYPLFKEIDTYRIVRVDRLGFFLPSKEVNREWFNTSNPLFPFVKKQIEILEKHYNATALIGALDRMPPGSKIEAHTDAQPLWKKCHRVHLPLVTHPDVKFYIDDVEYHFTAGKFFEFDNQRVHKVYNNSDVWRIHLLCDLLPNSI